MTGASAAQLPAYDTHKHILICHSEIQPTNSSSLNQSMLDTVNKGHWRKEQKLAARSKHSLQLLVGTCPLCLNPFQVLYCSLHDPCDSNEGYHIDSQAQYPAMADQVCFDPNKMR
jgi:hypothetical protein